MHLGSFSLLSQLTITIIIYKQYYTKHTEIYNINELNSISRVFQDALYCIYLHVVHGICVQCNWASGRARHIALYPIIDYGYPIVIYHHFTIAKTILYKFK